MAEVRPPSRISTSTSCVRSVLIRPSAHFPPSCLLFFSTGLSSPPFPTSRTLRHLVPSTHPSCGLSLPAHPNFYSGGLADVTRPTRSLCLSQTAFANISHPEVPCLIYAPFVRSLSPHAPGLLLGWPRRGHATDHEHLVLSVRDNHTSPPPTTKAAFYGSLVRSDNRIPRFTSFRDLARASYRAHPDICHHYSPSRSGRRCTVPNSFYGSLVRSDYRIRRLSLFRAIARPRACTASCPPRHLPPEIPIPLRPVLHLTVLFLRTPRAFRLPMPTPASIAPALLPSAR